MDMKQFVANFAAHFDETDATEFSAETHFRELDEWSSLTALSIIAMVDAEYGVQLKGEEIRNAQTITDLYVTVNTKL